MAKAFVNRVLSVAGNTLNFEVIYHGADVPPAGSNLVSVPVDISGLTLAQVEAALITAVRGGLPGVTIAATDVLLPTYKRGA